MKKLLYKELKLSASPLTFLFLVAGFLTFVPGYPVLVGTFFITLGIFYSFQNMRENNDIQYSLLLPVAKSDIAKSKFIFTVFIELCGFSIITVITLIRMIFMKNAVVYTSNALMCANFVFLGFTLLLFGIFNFVFVRGFFKTAYYFGKPFIAYIIISFIIISIAETLHHIPTLSNLNSFGFDHLSIQITALFIGILSFILLTVFALKYSKKSFDKVDL